MWHAASSQRSDRCHGTAERHHWTSVASHAKPPADHHRYQRGDGAIPGGVGKGDEGLRQRRLQPQLRVSQLFGTSHNHPEAKAASAGDRGAGLVRSGLKAIGENGTCTLVILTLALERIVWKGEAKVSLSRRQARRDDPSGIRGL